MQNIVVNYDYTNNLYIANKWLKGLPELFAADFEVASKWSKDYKSILQWRLNNFSNLSEEQKRVWLQYIQSNGFSHPSLSVITHLSVAWSNKDAYIIICDNNRIRHLIYNFLTTIPSTQIWHNAVFDFKHIFFHSGNLPKSYIDTQLLAKCLLNNANSARDRTGLKDLMAYAYGEWSISKEHYTLEEMWNENTIRYSATDSCATFKLYEDIQEEINGKSKV